MKKTFSSIFFISLFVIITTVFYLSFFGYETNRFNNVISAIIKENDKNVDLTFEKVKISLDIKKFSIFVKLTNPNLYYFKSLIPLKNLKADISLFSLLQKKNSIKKVYINTNYINFNSIKPIVVKSKPGNFKKILLNNVKKSKFKIDSELDFDENLKLTKKSIFSGNIKETSVSFDSKYFIKDMGFDFFYRNESLNLNQVKGKLEDLEIYDGRINYKKNKGDHVIEGEVKSKINSSGKKSKKLFSLAGIEVDNFLNVSLTGSASGSFNLRLGRTLLAKKMNVMIQSSLSSLKIDLKEKINNQFFKKSIEKIHAKDSTINFQYDDKKTDISLSTWIKTDEEFFNLTHDKKDKNNKFNVNFKKANLIKLPLINYSYGSNTNLSSLSGEYSVDKKNNFFVKKVKFMDGEDLFEIKNLKINKEYELLDFGEIVVVTKLNDSLNNDFVISNKNKIEIKGTKFDAKLLAKEISNSSKKNFLKNISKDIEIDFDQVLTDSEFPLNKFRLIGTIKKGKFEKISGKSEFIDSKYMDVSMRKEKDSNFKILEIHSDIAKPVINSYQFFDGLKKGNLVYESRFDDETSTAILTISNFQLIKAPAFAKLLTLADLQGLTDTLKGDGISFDTLVIKYTTDQKIMQIQEIFMIGPSISILIEGYVEKESGLISLRGTLIPAKTLNTLLSKIPLVGHILIGKKDGEGLFGVSFKIKGLPNQLKTTVNPVKSLTPRFITRALEGIKKQKTK